MSRCGRLTGTTGADGYHQEIFCEEESTFTDGNGGGVCTSCAVDDIADGGMVTPLKASLWADLIEEIKRRERENKKELVEALDMARAGQRRWLEEIQRLRGADCDRDKPKKELADARAEIERLRVLRRVDGAPSAVDAPRVPATELLEVQ